MAQRKISSARKVIYGLGVVLLTAGALVFLSTFLSAALHFGDFFQFAERSRSMAVRAVLGVALMVGGVVLQAAGGSNRTQAGLRPVPEKDEKERSLLSEYDGKLLQRLGSSEDKVVLPEDIRFPGIKETDRP